LMTAQIKDLRSGPGMGTRRGYRFSQVVLTWKPPVRQYFKGSNIPYPWKGGWAWNPLLRSYYKEEPCMSPFNTPILPVRNSDGSYHLVQDLQAIKQMVHSKHPVVSNPYTLLSKNASRSSIV
jgi:hypothetical protein